MQILLYLYYLRATAKEGFNNQKTLFTSKLDLNLRKKLKQCYIWSTALCGAVIWILERADQKYLEVSKCGAGEGWKISWTDRVRNGEVLQRVKEKRNIVQTIKGKKANWIGHILRRNCLVKHVIEGKTEGRIEVMGRRGRRRRRYCMALRKKEDTVRRKRKH